MICFPCLNAGIPVFCIMPGSFSWSYNTSKMVFSFVYIESKFIKNNSQSVDKMCTLLSYCFIAVMKHHEQGNLSKEAFNCWLDYSFEGQSMLIMVGRVVTAGRQAWNSSWELTSDPQVEGGERESGSCVAFLKLQSYIQWHTPYDKAVPLNPSENSSTY